ncbi:hypothetical protein [Dietzia natronolimnaea]|uniref:hypothetical protein n=1 Tax=Dietzia natronolimnaea TaxID=161920 RepID=UPI0011410EDA|nr:hypothetical protein [Dietzia natronolimnaea]
MVVWIVAEIASIRGFHVLQVVYVVTGLAVIWCTPRTPVPGRPEPDTPARGVGQDRVRATTTRPADPMWSAAPVNALMRGLSEIPHGTARGTR